MIPAPDLVLKQFKLGIFGEFFLLKRNNCCFAGCLHKTYIATHLDIYKSILFKLGMVRDAAILYIWCCSNWPWPSFKVIGGWWGVANLGKCPQKALYRFWDMLVSWTSYLFHLVWWAFREKNLLTWFHQKSWCCLVLNTFWPIYFKMWQMIGITELCSLTPVWVTVIFINDHSCMRTQILVLIFLQISHFACIIFSLLPRLLGLFKFMLNLFCMVLCKGENLN